MEDWQIVLSIVGLILGVLIPLLIHFNNINRDAHTEIGKNIKSVDGKVDEVNRFLRDHFASGTGTAPRTRQD